MYRLRYFKDVYHKCYCGAADLAGDKFSNYSIYDFNHITFSNFIQFFTPCNTKYLSWLYWYVLLMSISKIVISLREIYLTFDHEKRFSQFRRKKFHVISIKWRLKIRRVVGFIVGTMDCFLICGILTMRPRFMEPYIFVQFCTLALELLLWIIDLCCKISVLSSYDSVIFVVVYFNLESVWCIRNIFVDAIAEGRTKGYSLL